MSQINILLWSLLSFFHKPVQKNHTLLFDTEEYARDMTVGQATSDFP